MLPAGFIWYNYQTGEIEHKTGVWQTRILGDLEQGIFVKGGSIVPILEHEGCMALLACIDNPIRL
jgi:alpha-glucosidase (family GH31 glycosyl hydrolase)